MWEQNDFATNVLIASTPTRIARPAGWTGWIPWPASHSRSDISAEIGRNPSTPAGRVASGACPVVWGSAQSANWTPMSTITASHAAWLRRRARTTAGVLPRRIIAPAGDRRPPFAAPP